MNFPMPDFKLGMPIQRWAEQLREWAKTLGKDITVLKGDKGDKGDKGEPGPKGDPGDSYYLTQEFTSTSGSTVTLAADPTGQVRVVFTNTISAVTKIIIPAPTKEGWFDLFVQVPSPVGPYPGALILESPSGNAIKTYSIGGMSSPAGYIDRIVAVYFNSNFIWKIHSSNNWNA